MLVISKKKIMITLCSMFTLGLIATIAFNTSSEKDNYIETVGLPVSGKVVVIDARSW